MSYMWKRQIVATSLRESCTIRYTNIHVPNRQLQRIPNCNQSSSGERQSCSTNRAIANSEFLCSTLFQVKAVARIYTIKRGRQCTQISTSQPTCTPYTLFARSLFTRAGCIQNENAKIDTTMPTYKPVLIKCGMNFSAATVDLVPPLSSDADCLTEIKYPPSQWLWTN
ncbi:hypothetical protein BC943DRAFT_327597 [Umbelopsis sp. AD052]|nr:hypothetical protein BC943DRAFT_327597 [Umbelopsis sp. AD052]